ncbi:IS630 family transposase [Deinococcus sp.]|uniref:IS630 family transposase n=1 Tax=Deinococcus sp. TaxID=47478 RepID=UPI003CC63F8F
MKLTSQDRAFLTQLTRSGTHKARTVTRAQILLLADRTEGKLRSRKEVAALAACSRTRVIRVCRRYVQEGLNAALYERSRPGGLPRITGDVEAKLVMLACTDPPEGRRRWTLRLLADQMVALGHIDRLSNATVCRKLKANEIKPWQVKSWCIPKPSAKFVAKMEDVLDVYARPYDARFPVVCLDEASKELRSTPREALLPAVGLSVRQDYEYVRHGTANLFLSVEPLAGRRTIRVTERRTSADFARELRQLVEIDYRHADKVVLVMDNLSTHSVNALYETFEPEVARRIARRVEWHFTPEHASWLNIAEIELAALSTQCLRRRIGSRDDLEGQVTAWQDSRNRQRSQVVWQFRTEDARVKLRRLYPRYKVPEPA